MSNTVLIQNTTLTQKVVQENREFYKQYWFYCKFCINLGMPREKILTNDDYWEKHYDEIQGE